MGAKLGNFVLAIEDGEIPGRDLIGGKAWSVAHMRSLSLSVPPAFVVTTEACRAFLSSGEIPAALDGELAAGIAWLESETGRTFGRGPHPLLVSVRSGAPVSMPGMMDTVLNLGISDATEECLCLEGGNAVFARDTHRRFYEMYARIVLKLELELEPSAGTAAWRSSLAEGGAAVPADLRDALSATVRAVFESWNSRRARRYRQHQGIPDTLGTAVAVQAMVFGNLDDRSGTGVLFSRNPLTGEARPYGEYLVRAQGEDVVSGRYTPQPLGALAGALPDVYAELLRSAATLEDANADMQDIEFTVQRGKLFLLQSRSGKRAPQAAIRIAVEMVDEGRIAVAQALDRVSPEQARQMLAPEFGAGALTGARELASGEGASAGIGIGLAVGDADTAEARAAEGSAVVMVRGSTSPEDVHGMLVSQAVVTAVGGSTSHAAVVGRALGLPVVVGCGPGTVERLAGLVVTVDGRNGKVYEGELPVVTPDETKDPYLVRLRGWAAQTTALKVCADGEGAPQADLDLDRVPGGDEPRKLPELLRGRRSARGRILSSDAGVAAAVEAGLESIVVPHVLPALLAARQAIAARRTVSESAR